MTREVRVKAREGLSHRLTPVLLALGTGILLFLSFPGAVGLWFVAWVALIPLLLVVRYAKPGKAAKLGLMAGMVHYISLLYWIVIVLGRYGHLPWWVSIPALVLLALYMSSYLALFCYILSKIWKSGEIRAVWLGPLLWVGLDYVRGFLFSGFPWQDLGYSQYKVPFLIQTADLTGHFGITFHIVLVNCMLVLLITLWRAARSADPAAKPLVATRWRRAFFYAILPSLGIMAGVLGYNLLRYRQVEEMIATSPRMKIAVVQGNIEQDKKWSPAMRLKTIDIYTGLSNQAIALPGGPPDLLVWPETALPFLISDNPYFRLLENTLIKKQKIWLLAGAPHYEKIANKHKEQEREYLAYNSAYLFTPDGRIGGRYDKQHLVPFGEYVPFSDYFSLPGPLVENIGNFQSGKSVKPFSCRNAAIGVLICFESIFPKLARDWAANGANLLVNITNDAWFGRSSAPWQHLSMALFRAVENRRSLVRAANTGVSAIIDPLGRIISFSPLFEPFYLREEVPLLQAGTVFTIFGYNFGLVCLLTSVFLVIFPRNARQEKT